MPRIRRLRRRPDFLAAAGGRRFHTERMTAQGRLREPGETRDGAPAEGLHLGFTITKRVGHATERNRIRRRLRAAVAAVEAEAPVLAADIVLIARRPALDAPFPTLVEDLRRSLSAVTRPPRDPKDTGGGRRGGSGKSPPGARARTGAHVPAPDESRQGVSRQGTRDAAGDATPAPTTRQTLRQTPHQTPRQRPENTAHGSTDG